MYRDLDGLNVTAVSGMYTYCKHVMLFHLFYKTLLCSLYNGHVSSVLESFTIPGLQIDEKEKLPDGGKSSFWSASMLVHVTEFTAKNSHRCTCIVDVGDCLMDLPYMHECILCFIPQGDECRCSDV